MTHLTGLCRLIVLVALVSACSPRDPFVTMCGAAMDLEAGRLLTSSALAERDRGNASTSAAFVARAETALRAADGALGGIGSDDSDAASSALARASQHIHDAVTVVKIGGPTSSVEDTLKVASASLVEATSELPKDCLTPVST